MNSRTSGSRRHEEEPDGGSLSPSDSSHFDVFISHPTSVEDVVLQLADGLRTHGLRPWVAGEQMEAGSSVDESISRGLAQSRCCAVCVNSEEMTAWVRAELAAAVSRSIAELDFRVFLVLLPGVETGFDFSHFPSLATSHVWVDLREVHIDAGVELLAQAVRGDPPRSRKTPDGQDLECPFVGYRPFDTDDAKYFRGRRADVQKMTEALAREPFLAVVGNSGSGKSSAVRAGLKPALSAKHRGTQRFDHVIVLTPGPNPCRVLTSELAELFPERDPASLRQAVLTDPLTLGILSNDRVCWIVDQFEEFFTQASQTDETMAVVENLLTASRPGGGAVVVLVIRSDFVGRTTSFPNLSDRVASHQYIVRELDERGVRDAIEGPAGLAGVAMDRGLTERIVADGGAQAGMLPLLQHTLRELWQRSPGCLTHRGYEEIGGVQGSLARQTATILARFSEDQTHIARLLLTRMVAIGEGDRDTKRPISLTEAHSLGEVGDVDRVIDEFASSRLIRSTGDQIELTHDSLLVNWPQLRQWVDAARDEIRTRDSLAKAATEWEDATESHKPAEDYLLTGHRLASAREWRSHQTAVPGEIASFLDASVAAEQRALAQEANRRRRRWMVAAAVGVALSAFATFAVVQWLAANERRLEAETLALTAQARNLVESDPSLATLLAFEAEARDEAAHTDASEVVGEAVSAFLSADHHPFSPIVGHQGRIRDVATSPDGLLFASGGDDGTVQIREAATGNLRATLEGAADGVRGIAFSPDGSLLASGGNDGSVRIWNVAHGVSAAVLDNDADTVLDVTFSPDGAMLAAACGDFRVRVWDVTTGELRRTLEGHTDAVWAVGFAPDGRTLASAGLDGTAHIWDLESDADAIPLRAHEGMVLGLDFSPDGSTLATAGFDRVINLWDVQDAQLVDRLVGHDGPILDVVFSPDGSRLASSSDDRTVRIWDRETEAIIETFDGPGSMRAVTFSPTGDILLAGASDGSILRWAIEEPARAVLAGHDSGIQDVAFSPVAGPVATVGADGTVRTWDAASGDPIATFNGHNDAVWGLAISPDGTRLATSAEDGEVIVWVADSGDILTRLRGHTQPVRSVAFSPDGRSLASAGGDAIVTLWDIATASAQTVFRYDAGLNRVALSPDGRLLATTDAAGTVEIREVDRGTVVATRQASVSELFGLEFSPDGSTLAFSGQDSIIRLWDFDENEEPAALTGHGDAVWDITFSPAGDLLLSASLDQTVRIWDVDRVEEIVTLRPELGLVRGVAMAPDGRRVALAGETGVGHVMPTPTPGVLCVMLTRYTAVEDLRSLLPTGSEVSACPFPRQNP